MSEAAEQSTKQDFSQSEKSSGTSWISARRMRFLPLCSIARSVKKSQSGYSLYVSIPTQINEKIRKLHHIGRKHESDEPLHICLHIDKIWYIPDIIGEIFPLRRIDLEFPIPHSTIVDLSATITVRHQKDESDGPGDVDGQKSTTVTYAEPDDESDCI